MANKGKLLALTSAPNFLEVPFMAGDNGERTRAQPILTDDSPGEFPGTPSVAPPGFFDTSGLLC